MEAIKKAISEGKQLSIKYNGATRTINPHLFGTNKDNQERLRAVQVASEGTSHTPDWKLFDVSKIELAEVLSTDLTVAEGYKTEDSVITNVITKV